MIKKVFFICVGFLLMGCNNYTEVHDFEGAWYIEGMKYEGKPIYPQTVSDEIRIEFRTTGFENAEKITFNATNSRVILPGFGSGSIQRNYQLKDGLLIIQARNITVDSVDQLTETVFCQTYQVEKTVKEGQIILRSTTTDILLFSEEAALSERVNSIFNY